MENILRPIYQERASHTNTLAIIMIEKRNQTSPLTDNLDVALLVIVNEAEQALFVKHYEYEDKKASLTVMTKDDLNESILLGTNRRIVDWILNGKILFDRNEYIIELIDRLKTFPFSERKMKIGIEFAKLVRRYLEGKEFFESRQLLDTYNHVVHALHHLARLEVIDRGYYPEVTVWNQVKQIEPQIYKLYKELVESEESLEKRLELLFLASDFLIHSKTEIGAAHILTVMSEKDSWYFDELYQHPELKYYSVDLSVLLEFLVEKQYISIERKQTKGKGIYHRIYFLEKKY
ncbi:nucleotidyltransferase-like protein [Metabacillus endolithicus]|uniref:Nucleotidyltransferase-like protein n=1 Tax=Metabacillus endolithicus TaxID=1535204 RepID=A0ABW5C5T3_9BACI|nr:nucleotidyltransferase-like protein [Metabacillus endolithicus]UPG62147.1 nucleotidyltransferase-like protein [Metabacillus endolithicus]